MQTIESSVANQRSFAAATAAIAVVAGELAYQYGKSGEIFYTRFLTLAVLGLVAFASTFVTSPTEPPVDGATDPTDDGRSRPWVVWAVRVACLAPLGILAVFAVDDADVAIIPLLEIAALLVAPVVVAVLARIFGVDAAALPRRLQALSIATIAVAILGSYLVGANHPVFFSCQQFAVAGENVPDDCFDESDR